MTRYFRLPAAAVAALVLAGCASLDIDEAVAATNQAAAAFTGGKLELGRSDPQRQARERRSSELLAQPLSMDDAVQLALANSPSVQALIAQSWSDMAGVLGGKNSKDTRIADDIVVARPVPCRFGRHHNLHASFSTA